MKYFNFQHDRNFSTFGWECKIKPEEDTRKVKEDQLFIYGFSKWKEKIEEPNKRILLLNCLKVIDHAGMINKCSQIQVNFGEPFVDSWVLESKRALSIWFVDGQLKIKVEQEWRMDELESYVFNLKEKNQDMIAREFLKVVK